MASDYSKRHPRRWWTADASIHGTSRTTRTGEFARTAWAMRPDRVFVKAREVIALMEQLAEAK